MTLCKIRDNIERDFFGLLLPDEIEETIQAIEEFKNEFHYLPNDLDEWYSNAIELVSE